MNLLTMALSRMEEVKKPQRRFMEALFAALMVFLGRATMENLSRYSELSVRQIRYWASGGKHKDKDYFDFTRFNLKLVEDSEVSLNRLVVAIDSTFIEKAGKETHGLGHFYNGCNSRAEYGLEATAIALVDVDEGTAYGIYAEQTPPASKKDNSDDSCSKKANQSKDDNTSIDFAVSLLKEKSELLLKYTSIIVGDGRYATKKFVTGVTDIRFVLISRLRKDANMRYYYRGKRTGRRGRPRVYDGKVEFKNLSKMQSEIVTYKGKQAKVFTDIVEHKSFGIPIKVVVFTNDKEITGILFSTDTELTTLLTLFGSPEDVVI